ncbi:MAG: hypothetical protein ACRDYU_10645 [Actinomycetes bacterium]
MISHLAPPQWADVVADARTAYGPEALGETSVVVTLLDDEHRVTGRTLIRSADPELDDTARALLLGEALHVLRHGHSSGEPASHCLLLRFPPHVGAESTAAWRTSLERACTAADLRALPVLEVSPTAPDLVDLAHLPTPTD